MLTTRVNATFEATVDGAATGLVGTITARIEDGQNTIVVGPQTSGIVEAGVGIYTATLTAPTTAGDYTVIWSYDGAEASEDLTVHAAFVFATVDDVRARLGLASMTDDQAAQTTILLELATGLILDAVEKDDDWLDTLDVIPPRLRVTCIEATVRGFVNPSGARSQSETLGAHSFSQSWADAAAGMQLTEREERACRRAVFGTLAGSSRAYTVADHLARDIVTGGLVVEAEASEDEAA
jgi:hypothetical protein